MKKTLQIYMASTTFTCTEEAYEKLAQYLEDLRTYFTKNTDKSEVLEDIEARIAEKLLERKVNPVTLEDVTVIMTEIGNVADLTAEGDEPEAGNTSQTTGVYKKLYRDPDDAKIAGVASGLAAYFGIDPLLVRIAFVVLLFFGGSGLFAYILLWILVPKAETASQKLEMRGQKVTLGALEKAVRDSGRSIQNSGRGIVDWFERVFKRLWRFFIKVFGGFMALGSFLTIIAATTFVGIVTLNWRQPFNDLPIRDSSSLELLLTFLFSSYLAVVLPLIFITILGIKLLFKKPLISGSTTLVLAGIWAIAIIATGITSTTIAGDYYKYRETNPAYQEISTVYSFQNIEKLATNNASVTIKPGAEASVTVSGRPASLEQVTVEETGGVLRVSTKRNQVERNCLFCHTPAAKVTITLPDLHELETENGFAYLDRFVATDLTVTARDARLGGQLTAETLQLNNDDSHSELSLTVKDLVLRTENSHLNLQGQAQKTNFTLANSHLYITKLHMDEAVITANSSYVKMTPMENLETNIDRGTEIEKRTRY